MQVMKGYRIRIYPDQTQRAVITAHMNACRFMWNYLVELQRNHKSLTGKYMSQFEMHMLLKPMKQRQEYAWLKDISSKSLYGVCDDLSKAIYDYLAHRKGEPKYHSKKHGKCIFPCDNQSLYFRDGFVHIGKIGKMRYKTHHELPQGHDAHFVDTRVSQIDGKYFLSLCMLCENQTQQLTDQAMGIDLGVKEFAVVAYGDQQFVFHNINKSARMRELYRRIEYQEHVLDRKCYASVLRNGHYVESKNIRREREKLIRLYRRMHGINQNFLHQTSHA